MRQRTDHRWFRPVVTCHCFFSSSAQLQQRPGWCEEVLHISKAAHPRQTNATLTQFYVFHAATRERNLQTSQTTNGASIFPAKVQKLKLNCFDFYVIFFFFFDFGFLIYFCLFFFYSKFKYILISYFSNLL